MSELIIHNPRQVSEIVRGRRMSRRLSQQQIASKLNISQGRMSALENNPAELTLQRLITLAALLDLELVLREKSDPADASVEW